MTEAVEDLDRRSQRTRKAVFDAFTRLIFTHRYSAIRTSDLIEAAGVGRSTFYEHFRNKDDVLVWAIDPIFAPLAEAAAGRASLPRLRFVVDHLWERRALARVMFEPPLSAKLQRKLAGMIEARLGQRAPDALPNAMMAAASAAAQLALLRVWLSGEAACDPKVLAHRLADRRV
ncbi:TetR/AcrR family transcriptional regulator [Brevundimonas subvibrioides]|uniref:TetR/AcrR family transcriptional regulator n=1 Tax=Brevundimonas subvibrioides TaxID=74313 RepID=UPI0022B53D2C|nr:helix-turn-helix domain-containing protein [Brevundimonas subvibrioides]